MLAMFLVFAGNDVLEPEIFFINAVYLTLGTVTSILGAYSIEIHLRQNYWQARLLDRQARQLDRARLENQMHLHRINHPSIVDRLNKGETVIADVKEASVLFADIVGSTNLATRLGSNELVKKLNDIFRDLGRLVTDRQLETIKTIGDGCMVAGNCNNPLLDHVDAMVDLALAMRKAIRCSYASESTSVPSSPVS
jgi:class 3 adenylate cyclase